ncbi:MAG: hypothetical protein RJA41_297 [Actinomycetota bacterium]|jgi:hypothetical protein
MQTSRTSAQTNFSYSEIQFQPIWHALLALLVTSSLAIAYGSAVSIFWGWLIGVCFSLLAILWWYSKSVRILVFADEVQVGKFLIAKEFIGQVDSLDAGEFLDRIRSGAHRQDVFVIRNYSAGGVVIEIKDPQDPFCHWVISSKRPSKLAAALETRGGLSG